MVESRKARDIKVVLAVGAVIGVVVVIGYVFRSQPVSTDPPPARVVRTESEPVDQADGNESLTGEPLPLGSLLGCNQPAAPPRGFSVGSPPGEVLDLSTPAVAVYTVLSLLDRGATDKLAPCFVEAAADPASDLYPRCLGHPVSLVDTTEEEESAEVTWEATIHTAFSRNGKQHSPGETITLTSRLTQVEGTWKLSRLHE